MTRRAYHLGFRKAGSRLILEVADSVDQLSCELWHYYGKRPGSIANLTRNKQRILAVVNVQYSTTFQHITILRRR